MVPLVLRNLLPLLRDVDTVQFALDVAHARMRDNAARLAMLVPLLARARRLAPAGVDAEAAELMDQLEEAVVGALEARLQLVQVVTLLVVVRAVATARRAPPPQRAPRGRRARVRRVRERRGAGAIEGLRDGLHRVAARPLLGLIVVDSF